MYYSFFKCSIAEGREVLLDNSIFELGTAFDSEKFAKYVEELKPTYYVVPDVLETIAISFFAILFIKEDFPTLAIPTIATSTPFLILSPLLLSDKKNFISLIKSNT